MHLHYNIAERRRLREALLLVLQLVFQFHIPVEMFLNGPFAFSNDH